MTRAWEAEKVVDSSLALTLINQQFPSLEAHTIRFLGLGWDNTAFLINEKIIFRFPRRQVAVALLQDEAHFLPKLAPHLPLSLPFIQWKGKPSKEFPWPFNGYYLLPGKTACHAELTKKQKSCLTAPIAFFLKKLHSLCPKQFISSSTTCKAGRIDGNIINQKLKKNLNELAEIGLLHNRPQLEAAIQRSQNFPAPVATSVVHGDFYLRHLLLNSSCELTGVIDWGNAHIGDPANDLAIAHSFLSSHDHQLFRDLYGEIKEPTWQLARLKAILSSTFLILFGHHSKDHHLKREGLQALEMISCGG